LGSNAGNQIVINSFDLNKAEVDPNGYLGLKFKEKLALEAGTARSDNPFLTGNFNPADISAMQQGLLQVLTVYASAISDKVQTVTLALASGDASQFKVSTGANLLDFAGGNVTLTIPAGSDSVTFGLVYTGDPTKSPRVQLTSTLVDTANPANNSPVSNVITVTYDNSRSPKDPVITNPSPITGKAATASINGATVNYTDYREGVDGALNVNANNLVLTDNGNNRVDVGNGNNSITGGGGNDSVYAGSGGNILIGKGGQDILAAGNGNNDIFAGAQLALGTAQTQAGSLTASHVQGSLIAVGNGNNNLVGGAGDDLFVLGSGNNVVICGPGDNTVVAGVNLAAGAIQWGAQLLNPGPTAPNENYTGITLASTGYTAAAGYKGNYIGAAAVGLGDATLFGGKGNDTFWLSNGTNYVDAGGGNDHIYAGAGVNTIFAGNGQDTITGGGGTNFIETEGGGDLVVLQGGNSTVIGGSGNDTIYAGDYGTQWASSGKGSTYIEGGSGNNLIYGSGGNDTIKAGDGTAFIYGGDGIDYLYGGAGTDVLFAGNGGTAAKATQVVAGSGSTTIYGGLGIDRLYGGSGNNTIYVGDGGTSANQAYVQVGTGNTTVYGGEGNEDIHGGTKQGVANVMYLGGGTTTVANNEQKGGKSYCYPQSAPTMPASIPGSKFNRQVGQDSIGADSTCLPHLRKASSRAFTSSTASCCTQCPAPGTKSTDCRRVQTVSRMRSSPPGTCQVPQSRSPER
jgi:Ca2+-binding RTX toxin-like protein